jgi:hypothetical protein
VGRIGISFILFVLIEVDRTSADAGSGRYAVAMPCVTAQSGRGMACQHDKAG